MGTRPTHDSGMSPVRLTIVIPATDAPATLERCLAAVERAKGGTDEVIVVAEPRLASPAEARNRGGRAAGGHVLVFVDSDVVVHAGALGRIRDRFDRDPGLTAVFGCYDDEPAASGVVSRFRNLLHHHVHSSSPGAATTFWAGLGAIRRDAFLASGGFDERRYPRPSIEDVELGMRLVDSGARIELDPLILGTHLKRWTLASMVRTDFAQRGVPWASLLLERRSDGAGALNLGWRHRLSTLAALAAVVALLTGHRRAVAGSAVALVGLNTGFYRLLVRRLGAIGAVVGVLLHAVHLLTGAAAAATAVVDSPGPPEPGPEQP